MSSKQNSTQIERHEKGYHLFNSCKATCSVVTFSYVVGSFTLIYIDIYCAGVSPKYFSAEWSFVQFHLSESIQFIVALGSQNIVIIVGMDGRHALI